MTRSAYGVKGVVTNNHPVEIFSTRLHLGYALKQFQRMNLNRDIVNSGVWCAVERRIARHLRQSGLPGGKTLATFEFKAIPTLSEPHIKALAAGDWLETGANLIAIGNSGAGKTHLICAIGHALIETGYRVLYTRSTDLVQRLQAARRDLDLESALAKLDKFDLIILDDITYAHKDRAESSVLFELIARRYEHRSLAIAANQPFSAWDRIFPDHAITIAAIDRLVHHATILEMNVQSYRQRSADKRIKSLQKTATPKTSN